MGQEVVCTAHWGGKRLRGKALLETSELIFRGKERLKIPFSAIRGLRAKNGELRLKTNYGVVVFELGERAEKWREKIANPKSVVEKLGVKPGDTVSVLGKKDANFLTLLEERGANISSKLSDQAACVFWNAETAKELSEAKKIAAKMTGSMALWIIYPKGQKSIKEADVIAAGRKAGLKDVKVVGFSATHTALKFIIPVEKR
jgi:hypothetical protein